MASGRQAHLALQRVTRDLAALSAEPLPGIAARPVGEDTFTWHFNIRGARGELRGLSVHGLLRFPHSYPADPPQLRLCTPVPHPNVLESDEGYEVCMDMLEAAKGGSYSGWSSSYCGGSVLLQVQSALFDEGAGVYHEVTLDEALRLSNLCTCSCGHAGGRSQPPFPTVEDFCMARRSKPVTRPSLLQLLGASGDLRATGDQLRRGTPALPAPPGRGGSAAGGGAAQREGASPAVGLADKAKEEVEEGWRTVARRQRQKERPTDRQEPRPGQTIPGLQFAPPPPVCCQGGCLCQPGWGIRRIGKAGGTETAAQQRNSRRAQRRMQLRLQEALGGETAASECQAAVSSSSARGATCGAADGGLALSKRALETECMVASAPAWDAPSSEDMPSKDQMVTPELLAACDDVRTCGSQELAQKVDQALVAKFHFPARSDRSEKLVSVLVEARLDGTTLLKFSGRDAIAEVVNAHGRRLLRPRLLECVVSELGRFVALMQQVDAQSHAGVISKDALAKPVPAVSFTSLPRTLFIECLLYASAEDSARLALCGKFFKSLGEDGLLWRNHFSECYPNSQLTAQSMADWKHCFLLEVNRAEADLICYHTKASFREAVLGLPLDFSVNPRTRRVDYISTTLDLLSIEAFDAGVRLSQWNESFKNILPIFATAEHFLRARPRLEKTMVSLSQHWKTTRFHPFMVLEVVPKLMNTMVVLLCDKGLAVSDRALDGYFTLWRLLGACVQAYGLEAEVRTRLADFRSPAKRSKADVPSLGDFLPLISVSGQPLACWTAMAQPVLEESFDRNVLWACRDRPNFAKAENNQMRQGADMPRLAATFQSTKVSKRLLMFHASFLRLVDQQRLDLFFGRPAERLRLSFKASVQEILAVDSWPGFFAACGRSCPPPSALTDILKQAVKNSLRKGYHTANTDFSRIHASGVSKILRKGESYKVDRSVKQVRLELGSDSAMILCGACLTYEDLSCRQVVCYDRPSGYRGAVRHSGDQEVDGKSMHVIDIDLTRLPASVTRLFLTLCSCGCADLSGFKKPSIKMQDSDGQPLCQYDLERAGRAPTVVMAAILREGGEWKVTAVGQQSPVRCCGDYGRVKQDIARLRL